MWKLQIAAATVLASFTSVETFGSSVGKCDAEHTVPVPIPIDEVESHERWRVLYTTDFDPDTDHETYSQSMEGGRKYKILNKKVRKDKSKSDYSFGLTYKDNVYTGEVVDKSGARYRMYMIPLKVTRSLGLLLYRCSDIGVDNVYNRFIVAPVKSPPSESEIQEILAFDKATFGENHGTLFKLPEKIKDL